MIKFIRFAVFLIILLITLTMSCNSESASDDQTASEISDNNTQTMEEVEVVDTFPITLTNRYGIDTTHIASLSFSLGKGDEINIRLKTFFSEPADPDREPNQNADLIVYMLDPYRQRMYDAGRISGTFEFTITAQYSGDHILNLLDDNGHRYLILDTDYTGNLFDVSVYR